MKTLEEQMSVYQAYHRNTKNKVTHFIGVPLIIYSILIPMSWLSLSVGNFPISLSMIFVLVVLIYYLRLHRILGFSMFHVMIPITYLAYLTSLRADALLIFIISFVVGWIIQLIGHVFEGRKPALADNLFQIFVAPIFLMAEAFFLLGYYKKLQEKVIDLSQAYMPK